MSAGCKFCGGTCAGHTPTELILWEHAATCPTVTESGEQTA